MTDPATDGAAPEQADLLTLTADIVSAHVANNLLPAGEVGALIASVHQALAGLGKEPEPAAAEPPKRPVGIRASIKADGLISMIDGRLYQSLKRHLTRHGHSPDSYRKAYDLPADYPMVSAAYSEKRRALAKAIGLGGRRKDDAPAKPVKGGVRRTLKAALSSAKDHLGVG